MSTVLGARPKQLMLWFWFESPITSVAAPALGIFPTGVIAWSVLKFSPDTGAGALDSDNGVILGRLSVNVVFQTYSHVDHTRRFK